MNIYKSLNAVTAYIEAHLSENIDYNQLAKIVGVNVYTLQRIFILLTNVSLYEYIRKRRLSVAGFDLYTFHEKIIDVAIKYQYNNATSFSRAFESFHGIKPSEVKKGKLRFKEFPRIIFEETVKQNQDIEYDIVELDQFILYGKGLQTDECNIKYDAPAFWEQMENLYFSRYGRASYGMVSYENRFECTTFEYWVLWDYEIEKFEKVVIPKSKWLVFHTRSMEAKDIQKTSALFYCEFLPSCKFNIREIPELEYYHDGVTDLLIPIE